MRPTPPETTDSRHLRSIAPSLTDGLREMVEKMARLMEHEAAYGRAQRHHEQRMLYMGDDMKVWLTISAYRPGDVPYTLADLGIDEPPERPEDV